ncbi:hypothetical protein Tsubulata_006490 [Turnera subulata]|uniref:non-specific serine/threonine protein kinase n=1 Tax=Turnera subulata TaxID=218843 RepID=A0A9Q0G924_9ROSI|nr:hypothetical protein Tsubulata_006490 [Turnera subulata]
MGFTHYLFSSILLLAVVVCLPFVFSSVSYAITTIGNETDRLSLLEFKTHITKDPFGVLDSWDQTVHFCQWHGVICARRHQRVTALHLSSSKLEGFLSPHIGNLSFLRSLWLQNNSFSRQIPPQVSHLQRLQVLKLHNNSFTGSIPANLSACSDLKTIYLSNNKLVDKIPEELGSIPNLQHLQIAGNRLTGSIPPSLGNLSSLVELWTSFNNLGGSIPESLTQLTNLQLFALEYNNLSGIIPPLLYNISSIQEFWVNGNRLHGTLPRDLGTSLPLLKVFNIGFNHFTGNLPVSLSNASNLVIFGGSKNEFTGKIPNLEKLHALEWLSIYSNRLGGSEDDLSFVSSLSNATHLSVLIIETNNFEGMLPESIANLSTTTELLSLGSNQISGTIPAGIHNLKNLESFYLFDNNLIGAIPSEIGMLKNLVEFELDGNDFSGNIPESIGNLSSLVYLSLAGNNFQGHIPSTIGNCQNLLGLNLSDNNFTGTIPVEIFGITSLSVSLELSSNSLRGSLPKEVRNLINLGVLILGQNMLSGKIPSDLGSCVRLEILRLDGNFLQGSIPPSFSFLRGIQELDLSNNNLTGSIPLFLGELQVLEYLNISHNDFDGEVPSKGVFSNSSAAFLMGNDMLCGGISEFHLPKCIVKQSHKKKKSNPVVVIVATVSGLLGASLVFYCLYLVSGKKKREEHVENPLGNLQLSYQSLLRATDGFSATNLIGMGSFGSVYRGIIGEAERTTIAVKVLNLVHPSASKSFLAECEALRNIRHRNLVKTLTVCSSIDFQGKDFKAIVYEFMANGSLDEWLHHSSSHAEDEVPKNLSFIQRLNIAVDVACALDYLHHQCEIPLVHCDIKPSNILLNEYMTAHVADFGLARILLETNPASQTSSTRIKGTIGYASPGRTYFTLNIFFFFFFQLAEYLIYFQSKLASILVYQLQSMVWEVEFQHMVMFTAMASFCWSCLQGRGLHMTCSKTD